MFRANSCSSSGESIVLKQPLIYFALTIYCELLSVMSYIHFALRCRTNVQISVCANKTEIQIMTVYSSLLHILLHRATGVK